MAWKPVIMAHPGCINSKLMIIKVTKSYMEGPIKCKDYDATVDISSKWPLVGIGGVNREVVFGTACQLPDGQWIEDPTL